jgi:hypothetical protein
MDEDQEDREASNSIQRRQVRRKLVSAGGGHHGTPGKGVQIASVPSTART